MIAFGHKRHKGMTQSLTKTKDIKCQLLKK